MLGVTLIEVMPEIPGKPLAESVADVEVGVVVIKRGRVYTKILDDAVADKLSEEVGALFRIKLEAETLSDVSLDKFVKVEFDLLFVGVETISDAMVEK